MIPSNFIDELLAKVDIVDIIDELYGLLSVPQGKDAVVFSQSDQAVLSLFQLRGAWFGDWFCDGTSGAVVSRGGAVSG